MQYCRLQHKRHILRLPSNSFGGCYGGRGSASEALGLDRVYTAILSRPRRTAGMFDQALPCRRTVSNEGSRVDRTYTVHLAIRT